MREETRPALSQTSSSSQSSIRARAPAASAADDLSQSSLDPGLLRLHPLFLPDLEAGHSVEADEPSGVTVQASLHGASAGPQLPVQASSVLRTDETQELLVLSLFGSR